MKTSCSCNRGLCLSGPRGWNASTVPAASSPVTQEDFSCFLLLPWPRPHGPRAILPDLLALHCTVRQTEALPWPLQFCRAGGDWHRADDLNPPGEGATSPILSDSLYRGLRLQVALLSCSTWALRAWVVRPETLAPKPGARWPHLTQDTQQGPRSKALLRRSVCSELSLSAHCACLFPVISRGGPEVTGRKG